MSFVLGQHCKLYRNTGTYGSPVWDLIPSTRDLTLNMETAEADVTTRGNNGWRANVATLRDASIDFELVWNPTDSDVTAIMLAFTTNAPIELLVLDGPNTTPGSSGLRATCMITGFTRSEPLEEAVSVQVTAKPTLAANAPSWFVAA
jgi:hypothetical protein